LYPSDEPNAIQALKLSQIAKGFRYRSGKETLSKSYDLIASAKPKKVVDLAKSETVRGGQCLILG
jgi:hypothetical protein